MKSLGYLQKAALVLLFGICPSTAQNAQQRLVEAVAPVYPMVALYSATAGEVTIKVMVDATGAVTSARVVHGHKLLAASAEDAAKRWRFAAGSGEAELSLVFVYRIMPKGTPDADLATRFRSPNEVEIRRVIPEASTNSDPAPDPPRHKVE